jgi:hypothetical protein
VYDTPVEAVRAVEALDAEGAFRAVFDERAQPYKIDWLV